MILAVLSLPRFPFPRTWTDRYFPLQRAVHVICTYEIILHGKIGENGTETLWKNVLSSEVVADGGCELEIGAECLGGG